MSLGTNIIFQQCLKWSGSFKRFWEMKTQKNLANFYSMFSISEWHFDGFKNTYCTVKR